MRLSWYVWVSVLIKKVCGGTLNEYFTCRSFMLFVGISATSLRRQSMRLSSRQNVIWLSRASLAIICLFALTNLSWSAEQLIEEAVINKWKAYERFARSLQVTAHITMVFSEPDAAREQRILVSLKQNQNCISLCVSSSREEKPSALIRIANPKYAAVLRQSKSEPSNVVLERFDEDPKQPKGGGETVFEQTLPIILPHFNIPDGIPLSQILVPPPFKIIKISKISENGREPVRMDYRVVRESDGNRSTAYSGWVDLDPSLCWCIIRMKEVREVTVKGTRTMKNEIEVFEHEMINHPSGFPLMKRGTGRVTQHFYRGKEKTINSRTMSDFEWEVNDHVPDSEFTLTAYGLPEPGGEPVKKPIPLFVWILVAVGTCAVLALGFRYLARRRARSHLAI